MSEQDETELKAICEVILPRIERLIKTDGLPVGSISPMLEVSVGLLKLKILLSGGRI